MKTLKNLPSHHQNILLRVDWNIPTSNNSIIDPSRIIATLPTLNHLLNHGHYVTILTHRGRPIANQDNIHLSFRPLLNQLNQLCSKNFLFIDTLNQLGTQWNQSRVSLFENLRFFSGEIDNNSEFSTQLFSGAAAYVNDAFSVSHRAHASVEAITQHGPSFVGNLMEKELSALALFVQTPRASMTAICGGAKIGSKLPFIKHMTKKASTIALVGGIANTFLTAKGLNLGKSLVDHDSLHIANDIIKLAEENKCKLWLPNYVRVAKSLDDTPTIKHVSTVSPDEAIFDMAKQSYESLLASCNTSETIIWNGAAGVLEHPNWSEGTFSIANGLAALTKNKNIPTLAGGGETVMALQQTKTINKLSYVSLAGGAFMEYISGEVLPGVDALERKWRTQEESNP